MKVQKRDYLTDGPLPVVDQGQQPVAGYTDALDAAYRGPLPVVLFGDHTRVFKYVDFPFALGADGVKVLVAKHPFHPKFLWFYFRSLQIPSRGYSRHFKFLGEFAVPLVAPSEQRRIVEILDQAEALRKLRAAADAKAERILPALFYKMFGDPATNPMVWPISKLGDPDITLEFRYGTSSKCEPEPQGLPVLRIPNVLKGEIDLADLKYADLSGAEVERLLLARGDLLFVRTNGNREYVGRCAVFDLPKPFLFASYLIRARLNASKVDPWYVAAFLRSPVGRQHMSPVIRTTAGQSNISVEGLSNIEILVPPIEHQHRFRSLTQELLRLRRQRESAAAALQTAFETLLHRTFSGDLTAKWREAHMQELLAEMEGQAKALAGANPDTAVERGALV